MPKQLFQIKDFSGGLNTLKDSADINDNELQDISNLSVANQGSIQPLNAVNTNIAAMSTETILTSCSYNNDPTITHSSDRTVAVGMSVSGSGIPSGATVSSVTSATEFELSASTTGGSKTGQTLTLSTGITGLEENFGLGYFETDFQAEPLSVTYTADHSSCNHAGGSCVATAGWKGAGGELSAQSSSSAVNLSSTFSIGDKLMIDIAEAGSNRLTVAHNGIYTVTAFNGNNLVLDPNILTVQDIPAGGGNPWATATVTHYSLGDTVYLLANPTDHTIDTFTESKARWELNAITLRSSTSGTPSKVNFYKVADQIRCCDTAEASDCKIQWYGWIERRHFKGGGYDTSTNSFLGYYAKDNTLASPTEKTVTAVANASAGTVCSVPSSAGAGFAMHITSENDQEGTISAVKYEFAETFIYDGNQESLPVEMSTTLEPANDLKALSISIATKGPYDPRITGGRIYIREKQTEDEWTMLVDIDLTKGARIKLSDEYEAWFDNGGTTMSTYICPSNNAANNFRVKELGLITYEVLNGFSSGIFSNSLGEQGEKWKDATVANNRVFICNVTMKDENTGTSKSNASLTKFSDRIMYSMPNRFDTFPYHNYIEAAKGDAETYVAIEAYADRLFAYKQYSVDIINIASPDDSSWFLEDSKQHMGVLNKECVKRTQYGIIWINEQGFYLYNGKQIKNLIENKLTNDTWSSKITDRSALFYDEKESIANVIQSASTVNTGFRIDLKKATIVADTQFTTIANDGITNAVFNPTYSIVLAQDEGTHLDFYKIDRDPVASTQVRFQTKDFDFGNPTLNKRIYAVYITYKSDNALTNYFTIEDPEGNSHALSGTIATSASNWSTVKLTPSNPITVSKASVKMNTSSNSRQVYINDITVEYRVLKKRFT